MARIEPGDYVLFHYYHPSRRGRLTYLRRVLEKGDFCCKKGNIPWTDIHNLEYGDEVATHLGVRFFILRPSLADLMIGVRRLTTIAYPKDLGYILLRASIVPGVKVAEVGSGSGALTFVLTRYVQPQGHVYSFERRPEFLELAQKNLAKLNACEAVTFQLRDVAEHGYGIRDIDVCIVDVPEPWTIVPHAAQCLAKGGRWVSISPTTEQLQKTREALDTHGFTRFEAEEIFLREMLIRPQGSRPSERMVSHTVYVVFADLAKPYPNTGKGTTEDQMLDNLPDGDKLT
ncbi:tRNA (adenine-N1)-methyltransferase [candidate division WOR-3 bacterium]|nr:tRNA (adenine-N1)-methyltransferase [candidate division WOR-3 bacterium]